MSPQTGKNAQKNDCVGLEDCSVTFSYVTHSYNSEPSTSFISSKQQKERLLKKTAVNSNGDNFFNNSVSSNKMDADIFCKSLVSLFFFKFCFRIYFIYFALAIERMVFFIIRR